MRHTQAVRKPRPERVSRREMLIRLAALGVSATGVAAAALPGSGAAGRTARLVAGQPVEADRLDPQMAATTGNIPVLYHVYDTLFRYDLNLKNHPHLVASYRKLDAFSYQFALRRGVRFHNGREMNATDVQYSLMRAKDPKVVRRFADTIEDVRVIDSSTFNIKYVRPDPLALHWLAALPTAIVPKEEVEREGATFGTRPVGTGSFKLAEWTRGDHVTLQANDGYFLGRPALDELVFRTIPNPVTMVLELQSGKIDVGYVGEDDYERVKADKNLVLGTVPALDLRMLGFNVGGQKAGAKRDSPVNDRRVRLAIYHAVRWEDVFRASVPFPPFGTRVYCHSAFAGELNFPGCENYWSKPAYDVERAKQLLQEAGFANGFNASIVVWQPSHEKQAIIIQAYLKRVGINVEVRFLELATWNDYVVSGNTDMFIVRWGGLGMADPYGWIAALFSCSQFGLRGNLTRYCNPDVDQLMAKAAAAEGPPRLRLFREAQARIIQDVPAIPFQSSGVVEAWNTRVKGFRPDPIRDWTGAYDRFWAPDMGVRVSV